MTTWWGRMGRTPARSFVVAGLAACSPGDTAPRQATSSTASAATAPASAAPTTSASAAPKPSGPARLAIELKSPVAAGDAVAVRVVNAGGAPFRFEHPAGSNTCHAFRWRVEVRQGTDAYVDANALPRPCGMALSAPETILIEPGESSRAAELRTGAMYLRSAIYAGAPRSHGPEAKAAAEKARAPRPLPPGDYEVKVEGAGVELTARLTVTAP